MESNLDINVIKEQYPEDTFFENVSEDGIATLRLKCNSKMDFMEWLRKHQEISGNTWRVSHTTPCVGERVAFKATYRCQHNTYPKSHTRTKSASEKHTGCSAKLSVTIKVAPTSKNYRSKDALCLEFPTKVMVSHNHNHPVGEAETLRYRDPSIEVMNKFVEMFQSMHGALFALELHKQDLLNQFEDDYCKVIVDRAFCPEKAWAYRVYYKVSRGEFGHVKDVLQTLEDFIEALPPENQRTKLKIIDKDFVLASCSPLMERVHVLPLSGHICYIDSTVNIKRCGCRAFLLMCDSSIGGLPLGFFVASSETEELITQGIELLRELFEELLPSRAFGGRGLQGPRVFMIDDSVEQQNSLKAVFPDCDIWTCTFHILKSVWIWLCDSNQDLEQCRYVFSLFKKIVLSENEDAFSSATYDLLESKLDPSCRTCIERYLKRPELWWQNFCVSTKGSNLVRSAIRVLHDNILTRTRAFNAIQLLQFMYDSVSDYYSRKILDMIDGCYNEFVHLTYLSYERNLSGLEVKRVDDVPDVDNHTLGLYIVKNTEMTKEYLVDMQLGCCTCEIGKNGSPCKHRQMVTKEMQNSNLDLIPLTENHRNEYRWIATGLKDILVEVNEEQDSCALAEVDTSSVDEEDLISQPQWSDCRIKLWRILDVIEDGFKRNPHKFADAINEAYKNFRNIKTERELISSLHTFGRMRHCGSCTPLVRKMPISVQPSVQRKKLAKVVAEQQTTEVNHIEKKHRVLKRKCKASC